MINKTSEVRTSPWINYKLFNSNQPFELTYFLAYE